MTIAHTITEFKCRICGEPMRFDSKDSSEFISKSEHEDFFGMKLATYRVAHDSKKERHFNTIIVDHAGFFRGHRDSYIEPLDVTSSTLERNYWIFHEEDEAINKTDNVSLALLINRTDRWVIDIVSPKHLNVPETATLVIDRVEEASRVYDTIPQPMEARIADLEVRIWISDSRVLCVSFTNGALFQAINSVASQIVTETEDAIIPRRRLLNAVFRILEKSPDLSPTMLSRIMNEDMLFTTLHTPYEDRIASIVERTAQRVPIAGDLLGPLLRGYITLIDALEGDFSSRYKEVFELIDFINRRRILG